MITSVYEANRATENKGCSDVRDLYTHTSYISDPWPTKDSDELT